MKGFLESLRETLFSGGTCLLDEPMSRHTTFRVGGPAQYYVTVSNAEELVQVVKLCKEYKVALTVLGNGSNVLVSDKGLEGVVLRLGGEFLECRTEATADGTLHVTAGAGMLLSALSMQVAKEGFQGFEFAAGIPGSVGGAVVMNAGAYGGEIKDCICSVRYLNTDGELVKAAKDGLQLSYRHSIFSDGAGIVLSADFVFTPGNKEDILAKIEELGKKRREKQPLEFPSAGSTFKRPEGYFAGKLIMDAGLAGFCVGGAAVSEKHCGFVINRGNATAEDVYHLMQAVSEKVKESAGVTLEPEVKLLGEF